MESKMQLTNSAEDYGTVSRGFHWTTALLVLSTIPMGLIAASIGAQNHSHLLATQREQLLFWHKSFGVTILLLVVLRTIWSMYSQRPPLPAQLPKGERQAAKTVHFLLYGLLFAMPVTGIMLSQSVGFPVSFFGLFTLPTIFPAPHNVPIPHRLGAVWGILLHERILAYSLFGLLALHLFGLAKHHLVDKDPSILRRMAGGAPQSARWRA
jgi:cytochrome b561